MRMSMEGTGKKAAGSVNEEPNEHGDTFETKQKAQEGRGLCNEGRVENGKAPMTTEPSTGLKDGSGQDQSI